MKQQKLREDEDQLTLKETCSICGKVPSKGSLTSWIFRADSCKCGRPSVTGKTPELTLSTPSADADTDVDSQSDPVLDAAAGLGDRYAVYQLIGRGGMGAVYKVRDKVLNKIFAVKVMNPELVQDKVSVKRFEQEAQAASSLTNPNLAAVYGYGVSNKGSPYLVMDYLEGDTLEKVITEEGYLDGDRTLDIFIQAAEAIAAAHLKGVIHRDIKPGNIMLTKQDNGSDFVKLLDFGIAKILPSQQQAHDNLTQTGDIFGSPLYMSPEQCVGNMQDRRSDIYSLGCVMYEALTGIKPYAAENPIKIILKHVHEDPVPISSLPNRQKFRPDLDKVIMHCLERDPADRYQTADDLRRDLEKIRDGLKIHIKEPVRNEIKKPAPKRLRSMLFAAASVSVLACCAVMFVYKTVSVDPSSDAQNLDAKSGIYFQTGQYDKAAPLLEFGVSTYKERLAADLKSGNTNAVYTDEVLLAENWQHIGKCHLKLAEKATKNKDPELAKDEYLKALRAYKEAMPFYRRYGNYKDSLAPEALQGYADVLKGLNMTSALEELKSFAHRQRIELK